MSVLKYTRVRRFQENPRLNIRETKIIGRNGIKFEAVAEIVLRIDGLQYDEDNQIRLPEEWSPENIAAAIVRLLANHGTTVFQGFEKTPAVQKALCNSKK